MRNRWGSKRGAILEAVVVVGFLAFVAGVAGYDLRAASIVFGLILFASGIWGLSR